MFLSSASIRPSSPSIDRLSVSIDVFRSALGRSVALLRRDDAVERLLHPRHKPDFVLVRQLEDKAGRALLTTQPAVPVGPRLGYLGVSIGHVSGR